MTVVVLFKADTDGSDKFVNHLENHKFNVCSIACLDFQFINLLTLKNKLSQANDYAGLIFTSPRSVQAAYKANQSDELIPWKNLRNYTVGNTTGELAQRLLHLKTNGSEAGNAKNLSEIIINDGPSEKPFLFPSGNLKQDILEKALLREGIKVDGLDVYETIPHPELETSIASMKKRKIDYIVYFSPSGIKFSLTLIKKHEWNLTCIRFIAIGPSTKKLMEENGLECYKMCEKPSPESLLQALST